MNVLLNTDRNEIVTNGRRPLVAGRLFQQKTNTCFRERLGALQSLGSSRPLQQLGCRCLTCCCPRRRRRPAPQIKSLRFATEAAITILRIDDMIKLAPPQQQGR